MGEPIEICKSTLKIQIYRLTDKNSEKEYFCEYQQNDLVIPP